MERRIKKGRIHWNLSIYKKIILRSSSIVHKKKSYSMKIIWSGLWWWHLPFVWILLLPCADLLVEHSEALRLHLSCVCFWYPTKHVHNAHKHKGGKARRERERKIESIRNASLIQAECKKSDKKYWQNLLNFILKIFVAAACFFLYHPRCPKIQFKAWKHFCAYFLRSHSICFWSYLENLCINST